MAAVKTTKTKSSINKLKAGKKKPLNKWIIVGGIAAVAIIGAVVVRFSSASSYAFIHSARSKQLSGGTIKNGYMWADGLYKHNPRTILTLVSSTELKGSRSLCAHIKAANNTGTIYLEFHSASDNATQQQSFSALSKNKTKPVCIALRSYVKNGTRGGVLSVTSTNADTLGVDTMYGK